MNQDMLQAAKVTGETVGEVVIALIAIVHLLKKQPGFDVDLFDNALKDVASKSREDSIAQEIFKQCISLDDA